MKRIGIFAGLFLAGLTLLSACQKRNSEQLNTGDGQSVYLSLAVPDIEEVVVTRATASDIEKVIYSVWVLAFDNNGDRIRFENFDEPVYDGYESKAAYESSRALAIPKQTGDQYTNCTVWVLANVGKYDGADGSYDFASVNTLDAFKQLYAYRLIQDNGSGSASVVRDCLPMTGSATEVDLTQATSIGKPISIDMERAVARVSFKIDVASGYRFYFNNWSVEGLSRYTYVTDQGDGHDYADDNPDVSTPYNLYYPSNDVESALVTTGVSQWLDEAPDAGSSGFYTYENRRGGRLSSPDYGNLQGETADYAQEILSKTDPDGTDPKFKTLYAPENAAFLILTGLIRNESTLEVASFSYKIALGANNVDDYNLKRNHDYVYNIHINGLTYNDITVDAFDSRVHKSYALQISAPESQRMDAHFDKRYLDITASAGELELQLYPTMSDAEAGTNALTDDDEAWKWIRLSTEDTYNIDIDPYESVTQTCKYEDISRKRFFVYTDENLSTTSRSVVLKVTHTPAEGSSGIVKDTTVSRYYTYTQAGMIEVNDLWVESYEEYGMNLDPYSSDQPTQGLQWGWHGTEIDAYSTSDGKGNTYTIVSLSGSPGDFTDGSLYSDYAARYCDNKNKRDGDGNVIEHNWYLPAIDELRPLTSSITASSASWEPENMVGKAYWSSTVPTYAETTTNPWSTSGWQAILHLLWNLFIGSNATDPNFEFYYTKVAKAAIDGEEQMEEAGSQGSNRVHAYNKRTNVKHVRAVRVKDVITEN